jgi:myo-inositol-1-phosphate synthase
MKSIRIGIIGVGNCASSLIQGIHYYRENSREEASGLLHWAICGYKPYDIEVVAALDIDKRKVGKELTEASFAKPNCTRVFSRNVPPMGVQVRMGRILDGFPEHTRD